MTPKFGNHNVVKIKYGLFVLINSPILNYEYPAISKLGREILNYIEFLEKQVNFPDKGVLLVHVEEESKS